MAMLGNMQYEGVSLELFPVRKCLCRHAFETTSFCRARRFYKSLPLQALNDFGNRNVEGIRDAHEGVNGNVFLASLDVADVVVMQIGLFRQCFLTPFQIAAVGANVLTQYGPIFWSSGHIISSD